MPKPRVRRTQPAERDYLQIWLYIVEQAQETGAADGVLERFDEKLQLLAEFPGMGEAKPDLGEGVRTLPVGNYLLVYRPAAEGIELLRVLHGARDLRRLFFPPRPGETGR